MKQSFNRKSIALLISSIFGSGLVATVSPVLVLSTFMVSTAYAEVVNDKIMTTLPILVKSESTMPNVFNITGTNKLVVDFIDVKLSQVEAPVVSLDNPLVASISSKEVGQRVRMVIDVKSPVKYKITRDASTKSYILELVNATKFENLSTVYAPIVAKKEFPTQVVLDTMPEYPKQQYGLSQEDKSKLIERVNASINKDKKINIAAITPVIPQVSVNHLEVQNINIKKSDDKSAKITIDFNDGAFTPTLVKSENTLIIDLKGAAVPAKLQQNINTKVLGTVLQNVDIATQKGSARLVLTQKDGWDYSLYQMDKKLVIEVKNAQDKVVDRTFKGKPFSLNFQNMDVRAILQTIAEFTGLNVMSSDAISGTMSIRLKDVPWDQALDLVLEAKNLQKVQEGNVIWIATRQEITEKNKSALELLNQQSELAPLKLEFFTLNHYKAIDLKDVLEGKSSSASGGSKPLGLISKRGSVGLDTRNNTIFVQDNESSLVEIRKIIKRLDIPTRQVLIEAKLVVATDNFEKSLGAKFGIGANRNSGRNTIGVGNSLGDSVSYATNSALPLGTTGVNLPVTGGGALGFTIFNSALGNALSFELSALEKNNLGKVISSPRLLTSDNKKATIKQGTQIPYTIPGTGTSAPTVNFKDALLSLGVTPQVSPNGRIVLNLEISKDSVGQMISLPGGGQVPSIDTRSINTEITINDGQTVVLGGVYEVTSANDVSKVPLFGDIPFLGNLFKNTNKVNQKAELLIFITPHVVNDEDLDAINNNETKAPTEINLKK